MVYRRWEQLGIETSLLGFGCMRFPVEADGKIKEKEAEAMMDEAIASGVNYIDTAYPYHNGDSEPFVGRVLDRYERTSYYLATKLPCWQLKEAKDTRRIFEEQLKRLHKDYIDFYLLHALNGERFDQVLELSVIENCEELQKEGKIKHLGFSFHGSYEEFERILTYRHWDFCQIQYNYMDTMEQAGDRGYQLTEKLGTPVIVMEPVKGGSLAKLPAEVSLMLKKTAPEKSDASFALRWVASHTNVKVILSGMSDMEQTKDNLQTFKEWQEYSKEERTAVEVVAKTLHSRVMNGCTGCRYCMPCPAGVDIPENFRIWNQYHVYQNAKEAKQHWSERILDAAKAGQCIKCGKCESLCPQGIAIRTDLERLNKELNRL